MMMLKQGKVQLENYGSKKDLDEPTFDFEKKGEHAKLFEDLDTFKHLASYAAMDDER